MYTMTYTSLDKINWCLQKHKDTNHFYDKYLPYEFHLRMVVQTFMDFKKYIPIENGYEVFELACWGHDLIEDTRTSYNEVVENLGQTAADIIYAVTNEKGKNRAERGNEKYYEGIINTPGAAFVKLCDRIANVQYSKMTKSRMFEMYRKENIKFLRMMNYNPGHHLHYMFEYLIDLLKD